MRQNQQPQQSDFKTYTDSIMIELDKRRLKENFYKRFGYSSSLVSQWRAGKRKPSPEQEKQFVEVAVELIKEHDAKKRGVDKVKEELMNEFNSLISA